MTRRGKSASAGKEKTDQGTGVQQSGQAPARQCAALAASDYDQARRSFREGFWQAGGGFDRNVVQPHTLLPMIEYIHANPVRRGLVSRREEWKWSSAGWHEGKNSLKPHPLDVGGPTLFVGERG